MGGLEREGLKNYAEFKVVVTVAGMLVAPVLVSFDMETSGDQQTQKNNSLALPPRINNVPKMADIITSLNLCWFLLFVSRPNST